MTATILHTFRAGDILDPRRINDNLQELAAVAGDVVDRRYTHWTESHAVATIAQNFPSGMRTVPIVAATGRTHEVIGVRVVLRAAAGATWTLTLPNGETVAVETLGDDVDAIGVYEGAPLSVDDTRDGLVLSSPDTSTLTGGAVELLCRADRFAQGVAGGSYAPSRRYSAADTASALGALLNQEFDDIGDFRTADAAASRDMRISRLVVDATVADIPVPQAGGTLVGVGLHSAGIASALSNVTLEDDTGATITSLNVSGSSAGTYGVNAVTQGALDKPAATVDDWALTVTPGSGQLCTVLLFWQG